MAIRTRLVLLVVLLVALALAAIESITYVTVRSSQLSTIDAQMKSSVSSWVEYFNALSAGNPAGASVLDSVYPGTWAGLYFTNGRLVQFPNYLGTPVGNPEVHCNGCGQESPALPSGYVQSVASVGAADDITVKGSVGAGEYRLLGRLVQSDTGPLVLVIAFPLTGLDQFMERVLFFEVSIGACILVAVGLLSWFFVRLGLRPLDQMAATASEIAAGDLTKRVKETDPRTEVGQLGNALNLMLSHIENAFREKQASEDQLRRFVADASHELRTPLTSIRGYAELFKSGIADRPQDLSVALRRIESESSRMGGLVDDLLLLARLDQGRPLRNDMVDLTQLASDAVADARVVDPSRQVHLNVTDPCYVIGDEQRLRQVVGNLVTNALAYSPPGTPVEVSVSEDQGSPGGLTRLSVIDHGPGIAEDALPHIFERFWRADPSRMRASGGNGLGLSIVLAVVSAHHGRVVVQQTPGGGATFVVELPAALEASSALNGAEHHDETPSRTSLPATSWPTSSSEQLESPQPL